jgi:amino acid adenylation domain-containing protein
MVVGLLGILKAGGAYLPLDPGYPADRLAYMVADAQVPVLVTQAGLINQLPAHDGRVVCLDADWAAIAKEVTQPPTNGGSAENLAYAIYTSGSTGRPKGVMVSHRNVVNLLAAMAEQPGLSRNDVLLAVTPISFDIAGLEVFLPLVAGARLALVSRDIAQDGARLRLSLEAVGATVLQATPASWRMLFDAGWQGGKVKALCGGEALPKDLARTLAATTAAAWNLYGPTETTIWSTAYHLTPDACISIGRPISNTRTHVLDDNIEVAPIGVAGELYIGGEGVARGYLGRPGLTAERFVPSPFGCGKRLYRTGDRVRYLADGNMEFLGRRDNQVKVRGFRVEPREVEAALMQYAGVRQGVVVAREDAPGETRLVGYVVGAANTAIDAGAIRDHLREFVPDYMVPSAFVVLEALPLTPNGKLDRRALPAPEGRREAAGYVAPRTSLEEALATVWAEVLKLDRVGVHDNFFELGGHSLLAMKVCVQSRSILARSIDVSTLFSRPTIAGISEWLEQKSLISRNPARIVLRSAPAADHAICFLPSIVGYGSHYSHLARRLTTRAAIYSCRLMGTVTGETPLSNLEDIAAYCRGQLVVPGEHTKLSLVGWSFGGLLAYETSRQMTEAGIAIHRLVMLDSFLPDQIDGIDGNVVTRFARNLLGIDAARLIEHDLHGQESIKLARISEAYYRSIPRSKDSQIDLDSLFQTYKANLSALKSYQCGPYAGPLVEIHAEQSLHSHQRPSKQRLGSQKARPITLPGNHYSIITDVHVAELARILDGLF